MHAMLEVDPLMLSLVCAVAIKLHVLGCVGVIKPLSHTTMVTHLQTIDPMMQGRR